MDGKMEVAEPELQYGNARCRAGHPLWVVAEGYAYCVDASENYWYAWRFTKPRKESAFVPGTNDRWWDSELEDGTLAWVQGRGFPTKEKMLAFIEADIAWHKEEPALAEGPTYAEYLASVSA